MNFEPETLEERWDTVREVQIADTMGPTQKFVRNPGWYLASKRLTILGTGTEVVPGTYHIGATLTLSTSGHGTLGQRMPDANTS